MLMQMVEIGMNFVFRRCDIWEPQAVNSITFQFNFVALIYPHEKLPNSQTPVCSKCLCHELNSIKSWKGKRQGWRLVRTLSLRRLLIKADGPLFFVTVSIPENIVIICKFISVTIFALLI